MATFCPPSFGFPMQLQCFLLPPVLSHPHQNYSFRMKSWPALFSSLPFCPSHGLWDTGLNPSAQYTVMLPTGCHLSKLQPYRLFQSHVYLPSGWMVQPASHPPPLYLGTYHSDPYTHPHPSPHDSILKSPVYHSRQPFVEVFFDSLFLLSAWLGLKSPGKNLWMCLWRHFQGCLTEGRR